MAKLKCYSCPECGSFLEVDRVSDTFDCPFCGAHFNAFDFHGEDLLEQAKTLLRKNDFRLAREKYGFLLSKNPDRFEYLYGYACAVGEYPSLERFSNIEKYDDKLTRFVSNDKRYCEGPYSAYFAKLNEMFGISKTYLGIIPEQQKMFESAEVVLAAAEKEKEFNGTWFFIVAGIFYVTALPFLVAWASTYLIEIFKYSGFVALFLCIIFPFIILKIGQMIFDLRLKKKAPDLDARIKAANDLKETAVALNGELYDLQEAHRKAFRELTDLRKQAGLALANETGDELTSKFTATAIPSRSVFGKRAGTAKTDALKKAGACRKCGADLKLDKVRKLYVCDHCGSLYDYAFFIGEPLEKANGFLSKGEFALADEWFAKILEDDPSDFEANRGRILCAGGWFSVAKIWLSGDFGKIDWSSLQSRIKDAIANADDSNRDYFVQFDGLVKVIHDYYDKCMELKGLIFRNKKLEMEKESLSDTFNKQYREFAKTDISLMRELNMTRI